MKGCMSEAVNQIYVSANLSQDEVDVTESYIECDNDGCFIETTAYEKLFEYFCQVEEMPYGVAKARTDCPDDWIIAKLSGM